MAVYGSGELGRNEIWICDNNEPAIIAKGKIKITNRKLFEKLKYEILSNGIYVITDSWRQSGYSPNKREATLDGFKIYHEHSSRNVYDDHGYLVGSELGFNVDHHTNTRAEAYRLITGNLRYKASLLTLFRHIIKDGSDSSLEKEFEFATNLFQQLNLDLLDTQELVKMINRLWPNFGCYAFEGLRCTDIEIVEKYNIEELGVLAKKNRNSKAREILSFEDVAKENGKVLSLARQVHQIGSCSK